MPGQHIKLVRNDDYWGEKAKLDSVTFKVVGEDATRIAELQSKNAHITFPVSPSDVDRVDGLDNASIRVNQVRASIMSALMQKKNH